jgi:hypothetical protein
LSKGVSGDDPSTEREETLEEEEVYEDTSEGHLLIHPEKAPITLTGDLLALSRAGTALSEGICEDDPPEVSAILDAALQKPILNGGRDPEESPDKIPLYRESQSTWRSLEVGTGMRHVKGKQRFRNRRRLVKRGEYFEDPPELSISAEQAEWESVKRGPNCGKNAVLYSGRLRQRGCTCELNGSSQET